MTEEQILQKVEEVSAAMIESIRQMVQIDSTEAPAEPGAPFGPGVRKALDAALALSDKLGFEPWMWITIWGMRRMVGEMTI